MRVAIYARVSTDDKGQDPENQLHELRAWAVNSGHAISGEYVDYESGRKGTEKRKQFASLFDDAAKRKFDCVLFWALDRFSREGMAQTIIHLQRLSSYGGGHQQLRIAATAVNVTAARSCSSILPFFRLHTLAKLPHCKLSPPHLSWLLAAPACGGVDSNISAADSVTISIRMIWLPFFPFKPWSSLHSPHSILYAG